MRKSFNCILHLLTMVKIYEGEAVRKIRYCIADPYSALGACSQLLAESCLQHALALSAWQHAFALSALQHLAESCLQHCSC